MSNIYYGSIGSLFDVALPSVLVGPSFLKRLIPKGRLELGIRGLSRGEFIGGAYGRGLISSADVLEDL